MISDQSRVPGSTASVVTEGEGGAELARDCNITLKKRESASR